MSYAIIRNIKHKKANLQSITRHNERLNKEYGNKDIDKTRTVNNYHLRVPEESNYEKEFFRLREINNLKGNLRLTGKKQSNVACEFLIASDSEYFKNIGEAETNRYFKTAYDFACNKVGEKNIISAVVHMDEATPHMHLTYIPVVKGQKKGQEIEKINCSEFWKGFNSYGVLQDEYHAYMVKNGFRLERGVKNVERDEKREHLEVEKYKIRTLQEELRLLEEAKEKIETDKPALKVQLEYAKLKGLHERMQSRIKWLLDLVPNWVRSLLAQILQDREPIPPIPDIEKVKE